MPEVPATESKSSVYIPGGKGSEALKVGLLIGGAYTSGNETYQSWEGSYLANNGDNKCTTERVPGAEVRAREAYQRLNYQLYHLSHTAEPAVVHAMKQAIRETEARVAKEGTIVPLKVVGLTRYEQGVTYINTEDEQDRVFMGGTVFPERYPELRISDGLLNSALQTSRVVYAPQDQTHEAISIPLLDMDAIQKDPEAATVGSHDITTLQGVEHVKQFLSDIMVLERSKAYHPGIGHSW